MEGSQILLMDQPKGHFEHGYVGQANIYPGTFMEIKPNVNPISGRFTWMYAGTSSKYRNGLHGAKGNITILMDDYLQGGLFSQVYTLGRMGQLYWPLPGEELNAGLNYSAGSGTSTDELIGDLLEIDGSSGLLHGVGTNGATGSHVSAPFWLMEQLGAAIVLPTWASVKYLGGYA